MRTLTRAGATMIELALGLVLLALFAAVGVAIVRMTALGVARATGGLQADRTALQLALLLEHDLAVASDSDVHVISSSQLAFPRAVGTGIPCADSDGVVFIADSAWHGVRLPEAGRDLLRLLVDPDSATWWTAALDTVTHGHCPGTGLSALRLVVAPHPSPGVAASVIEPVELSAYRSGADDWFGLLPASHSSSVQPFAGPLVPATTRFAWRPGQLDLAMTPSGAAALSRQLPLAATP